MKTRSTTRTSRHCVHQVLKIVKRREVPCALFVDKLKAPKNIRRVAVKKSVQKVLLNSEVQSPSKSPQRSSSDDTVIQSNAETEGNIVNHTDQISQKGSGHDESNGPPDSESPAILFGSSDTATRFESESSPSSAGDGKSTESQISHVPANRSRRSVSVKFEPPEQPGETYGGIESCIVCAEIKTEQAGEVHRATGSVVRTRTVFAPTVSTSSGTSVDMSLSVLTRNATAVSVKENTRRTFFLNVQHEDDRNKICTSTEAKKKEKSWFDVIISIDIPASCIIETLEFTLQDSEEGAKFGNDLLYLEMCGADAEVQVAGFDDCGASQFEEAKRLFIKVLNTKEWQIFYTMILKELGQSLGDGVFPRKLYVETPERLKVLINRTSEIKSSSMKKFNNYANRPKTPVRFPRNIDQDLAPLFIEMARFMLYGAPRDQAYEILKIRLELNTS